MELVGLKEVYDVLTAINETLGKIERNQRLYTKVVLGNRTLSVPYSQVKDMTPEESDEFGGKS
jgi:hypothetical protein